TGVFLPKGVSSADLWKGQYFGNNLRAEQLLKDKDIEALRVVSAKATRTDHKAALDRLIDNKKVMSMSDYHALDGLAASGLLPRDAKSTVSGARRAVMHTPRI